MFKIYSIFALLAITVWSCENQVKKSDIISNIPSLEELSGKWVSVDTVDMEPSIRNFRGQALVNHDMSSISWFVAAPYSGGYHTGSFRLNGKTPLVKEFRWQPYQALRKTKTDDGFVIESSTRMPVEKDAIMWQIELTNTLQESQPFDIEIDFIGFISKYDGDWQWWYPYPKIDGQTTKRDDEVENVRKHIGKSQKPTEAIVTELVDGKPTSKNVASSWPTDKELLQCKKHTAKTSNNTILISDTETNAITGFTLLNKEAEITTYNSGGTARLKGEIAPGQTLTIKYIMAYGDDEKLVKENLVNLENSFDSEFANTKSEWKHRWEQLFTPNNEILSGTFPVLETTDALAKKVYYTGPLTMLYLMNTNLPQHKKVFLTGGPRWGASITFFWDITEWSTLWATVDPEMMKEHLSSWISIDPSKNYGQDNFGGKGVGNGYSANYWALFQMIRAYITISGDYEFLEKELEGKTVLQHLEHYATNWKRISIHGQKGAEDDIYKLADFGDDEWNLLECVPTYKHIVPSFNAGYIWMMRETAAFYKKTGNSEKANQFLKEADQMVERLLKLYAGNGVWNSLYPNGEKIEVRHCLDFMFMGRYLPNDIPKDIKAEMMDFAYRELITDNWMRAQSLSDVAAEQSDRADHGPLGAFDGWPAGTMDALSQLGFPDKALDFYHAIEPVTNEGIWSQAHELWGDNKYKKNAKVRIAERGWHNRESSSGIAMSQVMLKNFFGFYPDVAGTPLKKINNLHFEGNLYHVKYAGDYYTLKSKEGKVEMIKEDNEH
ncbi:MAG: hypothetical protein JEZ09_07235 [Salinivirgaceae bacterium]|nr:hypothetical protein [Salinivirgaceae bacterium]